MSRTQPPKPLTGGKVFLMLVAFFGVVIAVNLVMMRFAIQTLPGTEVDSAYSASLAYEKEIATARDQSARNWKVDAHVERSGQGGATLQVEARDSFGRPMSGPEVSRPVRAADRPAGRSSGRSRRSRDRHLSRKRRRRCARPMGSGARRRCGRAAVVPVQEPRAVELGRLHHAGDARFFTLCPSSRIRVVAYRSGGRGRQLRRLHVEDRARPFGASGRDTCARQSDRPPRGAGVEGRIARSGPLHRSPGGAWLQGLSVRAGSRRGDRDGAGEFSASLPWRRGLCRDERDDAVGSGLVRQRDRVIRNNHLLGTKLRTLRKEHRITLEDLSARCAQIDPQSAPSESYLSMIESGRRNPSQEVLAVVASSLPAQASVVSRSECGVRAGQSRAGGGRRRTDSFRAVVSFFEETCCRLRSPSSCRRREPRDASSRIC